MLREKEDASNLKMEAACSSETLVPPCQNYELCYVLNLNWILYYKVAHEMSYY